MNLTQEQITYLRSCHPQIAIPCYGGQLFETVMVSMIKFVIYATKIGMPFSVDTVSNESLIPRGRNTLAAKFMENSMATHLMWIDSDIRFQPEDIFKLLLHDKDIVGGLYPKKTLPIDYVVNVSDSDVEPNGTVKIENGLIRASRLGTGFMLIKRDVFNKMFAAYPQTKFVNNIGLDIKYNPFMYALFDCVINPDTHEYCSEDWVFCDRWRAIGGECFVDPSVQLGHSGFFVYPGKSEDFARILSATPDVSGNVVVNIAPRIAVRPDILKTGAAQALKPQIAASPTITEVQPEQVTTKGN
jgi:hypothetical protein